jgi:hypothetical protein
MRLMKMLGMAVLAALASTALVGAGSATAQKHRVVFCKANEELCKEGGAWADETFFLGKALKPIFLGFPVECDESYVAGLTLGEPGSDVLLLNIELLTFVGNCTTCPEVLVESLPYTGHVYHEASGYVLSILSPLVLFDGCPLVGKCGYNAEEIELELQNKEGYILALANKAPLQRHAGSILCPGSVELDADYLLLPSEGHEGEHLGSAWISLLALNE